MGIREEPYEGKTLTVCPSDEAVVRFDDEMATVPFAKVVTVTLLDAAVPLTQYVSKLPPKMTLLPSSCAEIAIERISTSLPGKPPNGTAAHWFAEVDQVATAP